MHFNMDYTVEDYKSDLKNSDIPHIKSREHFQAFYNELGKHPVQHNQVYQSGRMNFVKPKGSILELGCHWGFDLVYWATLGFHCTGIDVSETLIEYGNGMMDKLQPEIRDRIKLICGWIEDYQPTQLFDTIVLTETLEHVIDPLPILQKAVKCMKVSSLIYISAPAKRVGTFSHVRGINEQEMGLLLRQSGLQAIEWNADVEDTKVTAQLI